MADALKLAFSPFAAPAKGVLVVFCDDGLKFGPATRKALAPAGDLVKRAAAADRFQGQERQCARHRRAGRACRSPRLVVIGVGKAGELKVAGLRQARRRRHGQGSVARRTGDDLRRTAGRTLKPDQAADLALGMRLRAYAFDRYKTKRRKARSRRASRQDHDRASAIPRRAQKAWARAQRPVADGVMLARDLVNEPANVLYPGGIRPPRAARSRSSASRSRCST